jgi:hypothetical protein
VLLGDRRVILTANVGMMSILDLQKIPSLLYVVGTTKESIHLLKPDLLGFGDEKPDE